MAALLLRSCLASAVASGAAPPGPPEPLSLKPVWLPDFVLEPHAASTVAFTLHGEGSEAVRTLSFVGHDYRGNPPGGWAPEPAPVNGSGVATLTLNHSLGYYEYRCVQTNQSFGFVALPTPPRPFDDRFAVVSGFTQICNTAPVALREPLLAMLARLGIGHYR